MKTEFKIVRPATTTFKHLKPGEIFTNAGGEVAFIRTVAEVGCTFNAVREDGELAYFEPTRPVIRYPKATLHMGDPA